MAKELFSDEIILYYPAVFFYLVATVIFALGVIFQKEKLLPLGGWLTLLGLIPHGAALLLRWSYVWHGPYITKYEVLSSNAWVALALFLCLFVRFPWLRFLGFIVVPLSFLMLGIAISSDKAIKRLPPTFENFWLFFHILLSKLAVGAFLVAFALNLVYLIRSRKKKHLAFLERFPTQTLLDDYIYRLVTFGFCFWTAAIAAGAIWAQESWGRYWGWDPVETWSLITWFLFGIYLHLRLFSSWRGLKSALFLMFAFLISTVTIFFLPFLINGLHSEYFR